MRQSLHEFCLANNMPLLDQWHPVRNEDLEPSKISRGSQRKVWWICDKGHEWQTKVSTRTGQNCGCPVCAGKLVIPGVNDLASADPELIAEWADEKIAPTEVTPSSNRKVWWRCGLGHMWQAPVADRYTHTGLIEPVEINGKRGKENRHLGKFIKAESLMEAAV